jgi:hypothetical protein
MHSGGWYGFQRTGYSTRLLGLNDYAEGILSNLKTVRDESSSWIRIHSLHCLPGFRTWRRIDRKAVVCAICDHARDPENDSGDANRRESGKPIRAHFARSADHHRKFAWLIQPAGTFYLQSGIDEVLSGTSEFILRTVPSMSKYVDPFGLSKAFIPHLSQ